MNHKKLQQINMMNLKTMNKIITGVLLMLTAVVSQAQTPTGRNQSTYHAIDTSQITDIREKLVQLALQNPNFEIADRNVNVATYNLRKAKGSWLGLLSASGNLNELSLKKNGGQTTTPGEPTQSLFFPRYNFSLNLPLDFFTAKANDVKAARENVYIAAATKNEQYRQIRKDVLSKYEDYLMHKEKLELQTRLTQSEYTDYKLAEKDFADGLVTPEAFKAAEANYYKQQMQKLDYQRNFSVARLELEQLIGVSIDDVLGKK
jgi:outer membrane protein TolC